jgi:hypothetical protein
MVKKISSFFGLFICLLFMAFSFGCSNDQSLDGAVEVILYHVPNWTTDGRIIAHRETVRYRETFLSEKDPLPGSNEVVIMDADGENEETLFSTGEINISRLELSPSGNYVGMLADVYLLLYSINGDLLKKIEPEPTLSHIKFSPDESKLYGSEYFASMSFFDVPELNLLTQNEFGGGGAWMNLNTIIYEDTIDRTLSTYNLNGDKILLNINLSPDVFINSSNTVFGFGGTEIKKFVLEDSDYSTNSFSYSPYDYSDFTKQQLSPDGKEIVMGVQGPASFNGTGIHILTIETNQWRRLR